MFALRAEFLTLVLKPSRKKLAVIGLLKAKALLRDASLQGSAVALHMPL